MSSSAGVRAEEGESVPGGEPLEGRDEGDEEGGAGLPPLPPAPTRDAGDRLLSLGVRIAPLPC